MKNLETKYIELLLNRCLNFDNSSSLMIHCDLEEHLGFVKKIKAMANKLGIVDVCIHINDLDKIHEYLKKTSVDEIKLNPLIDRTDWNTYALKGASLLFINSVVPGLMDDIPAEKIQKWFEEREKSTRYYRANVGRYTFPWCIAMMPNERWAKTIFKDSVNAYDKLYLDIMKMCMVDRENPVSEWDKFIQKSNYYKNRLNELQIRKLKFTNSLGTNFSVEIPEGNVWLNLDKKDANGGNIISNMPSYEIFTSPDYRKTDGIIYSSKPLFCNGCCIEDFSITYHEGKAIKCFAKKGQEVLERILFENENANYLGEVALVPLDSPISETGLVYNATLFDENSSPHVALGSGFAKTFKGYEKLSQEELKEKGLNVSNTHVDFMFGTRDLDVVADTVEGQKLIFKKGNFNI